MKKIPLEKAVAMGAKREDGTPVSKANKLVSDRREKAPPKPQPLAVTVRPDPNLAATNALLQQLVQKMSEPQPEPEKSPDKWTFHVERDNNHLITKITATKG